MKRFSSINLLICFKTLTVTLSKPATVSSLNYINNIQYVGRFSLFNKLLLLLIKDLLLYS